MIINILFILTASIVSHGLLTSPGIYQVTNPVDHAECPTWDIRNNVLYFVNIHQGEIYKYYFLNDTIQVNGLNGAVAPVIPSKDDPNLIYAGLNLYLVAFEWDGETHFSPVRNISHLNRQDASSRVNDGKADKYGRLWLGTMGFEDADSLTPNQGVLYKITCENLDSPEVVIAPVNISNGLAFNKANDKLFYIDTPTRQVMAYDFDVEEGTISNPQVVFDVTEHDSITGSPDGMTIDREDNLWVALYGGGAVVKVDPLTRELLEVVALPALDVTSAMWGGPDLDILFVTTSRVALSDEERRQQPAAGSVFAIVGLGTQGLPMYGVDILNSITDESCSGNW